MVKRDKKLLTSFSSHFAAKGTPSSSTEYLYILPCTFPATFAGHPNTIRTSHPVEVTLSRYQRQLGSPLQNSATLQHLRHSSDRNFLFLCLISEFYPHIQRVSR